MLTIRHQQITNGLNNNEHGTKSLLRPLSHFSLMPITKSTHLASAVYLTFCPASPDFHYASYPHFARMNTFTRRQLDINLEQFYKKRSFISLSTSLNCPHPVSICGAKYKQNLTHHHPECTVFNPHPGTYTSTDINLLTKFFTAAACVL